MISMEDCVALCGLSPQEIAAVAEHEHIPQMAATALASYLLHRDHGPEKIRNMIVDDIRTAIADHKIKHAAHLLVTLRHYLETHPSAQGIGQR